MYLHDLIDAGTISDSMCEAETVRPVTTRTQFIRPTALILPNDYKLEH